MLKQATLQSTKLPTIEDAKFALGNFNIQNEKLHPLVGGVFGHGEQGIGHGEEVTNAQCPMPKAAGRLSLSTHEGMEFPAAFNEIKASAWANQGKSAIDDVSVTVPTCICLDLEDLKCFEAVERQYEHWGVIFHNSLAIQPSNPAFPSYSGLTVLMGAPKSGLLEATFLRPVNSVSAFVTSSQRLVLSAYDRDRQLLGQAALPSANLANSDSVIPPNTLLSINVNNIYSVTFCVFDGQFTLDNFRFCL